MNLTVGNFDIPVSALNVFDTLAILLLIPVFDRFIYPAIGHVLRARQKRKAAAARSKLSDSSEKHSSTALQQPTMLQKTGAGFAFAALAVIAAAIVEVKRKERVPSGDVHTAVISHCQHESDYSPAQFQKYYVSKNVNDEPSHCR